MLGVLRDVAVRGGPFLARHGMALARHADASPLCRTALRVTATHVHDARLAAIEEGRMRCITHAARSGNHVRKWSLQRSLHDARQQWDWAGFNRRAPRDRLLRAKGRRAALDAAVRWVLNLLSSPSLKPPAVRSRALPCGLLTSTALRLRRPQRARLPGLSTAYCSHRLRCWAWRASQRHSVAL